MSMKQNDVWLEAAWENLQHAIENGDYAAAKDVIVDTFDAGFADESRQMNIALRNMPIENFCIKSPYQII